VAAAIGVISVEHAAVGALGQGGFQLLGVGFFALMCVVLYRISRRPAQL
jgi:hypothetical protein